MQIIIKEHDIFEREGDDLHEDLPLSFATAALGGEVSVPTMDTETRITIPEGTQSGKVLRLRGKGVPNLRTGQKGDLYVHVYVETPVNLSAKQKRTPDFAPNLERSRGFVCVCCRFYEIE